MTTTGAAGTALAPTGLRQAFGQFPSGVVAVTAEVDGELVGLAASSFTSVSLDPPLVSIAVAHASRTWPVLRRADHLGVSVLADHHAEACRRLAGPADQRFADLALHRSSHGTVTVGDALARFETTVHREVEAGDHLVVLLRVHALDVPAAGVDARPLVFHRSAFGLEAG